MKLKDYHMWSIQGVLTVVITWLVLGLLASSVGDIPLLEVLFSKPLLGILICLGWLPLLGLLFAIDPLNIEENKDKPK